MTRRRRTLKIKARVLSARVAFVAALAVLRGALTLAVLSALMMSAPRPAQAQTETVLYSFTGGSDGGLPGSSLALHGGNLYGTTITGGPAEAGTVFELSPNSSGGWNESVLYAFCSFGPELCPDGAYPSGPVVFDSVGNLYGITPEGGNSNCGFTPGCGVAFELSPVGAGWTENVVYDFCSQFTGGVCHDGDYPGGGVIMDAAGNLYGQVAAGAFELSPSSGGWTDKLISINLENSTAGLTMDAAGNIFGLAFGQTIKWEVFELSPNGKGGWNSTVLFTFTTIPSGVTLWSPLALDRAGNIYGTETPWYSVHRKPIEFIGVVYKLSPGTTGWTKKAIYTFAPGDSELEGNAPSGGLVLDAAGNIYGTTIQGGTNGLGTVFELVAPVGAGNYEEKVLWNFNGTDGSSPNGGLILDSTGNLYGTASAGGSSGAGVVFEVSHEFAPAPTATTLASSVNPYDSTYGRAITFAATVISTAVAGIPPNGDVVTFKNGSAVLGTAPLSGGIASLTTSSLPVGTLTITASYSGDANFAASTSPGFRQVVHVAATAMTLVSGLNPSMQGQSATFTATVAPPYGTIPNGELVTFYDDGAAMGTAAMAAGVATFTTSSLTAKTHTIKAAYAGDSDFKPSVGKVTQVVDKDTTTTALASTLNSSIYGQKVTWKATVTTSGSSIPAGTVKLVSDGESIGVTTLDASGVATLTKSNLDAGSYPLTAVYLGNATNAGSTSAIVTQVVEQATSGAALSSSPNPSVQGQLVTFTAKVTSPTTAPVMGSVTFTAGETAIGTVALSGGRAVFTTSTLPVGSTTITGSYLGDSNIAVSSASVTQTVQQ
jgi:uncharacterized repeat protein (TIGR03803 family)